MVNSGFLIDRRCPSLIKGFEGGYHYKRMEVSGERYADKPDKNMYSHIHDALQYLMLGAGEGRQLMSNHKPIQAFNAKKASMFCQKAKRKNVKVYGQGCRKICVGFIKTIFTSTASS